MANNPGKPNECLPSLAPPRFRSQSHRNWNDVKAHFHGVLSLHGCIIFVFIKLSVYDWWAYLNFFMSVVLVNPSLNMKCINRLRTVWGHGTYFMAWKLDGKGEGVMNKLIKWSNLQTVNCLLLFEDHLSLVSHLTVVPCCNFSSEFQFFITSNRYISSSHTWIWRKVRLQFSQMASRRNGGKWRGTRTACSASWWRTWANTSVSIPSDCPASWDRYLSGLEKWLELARIVCKHEWRAGNFRLQEGLNFSWINCSFSYYDCT